MYDQDQINDLQDTLETILNRALHEDQDYELAAQCARAMDAFKKWAAGGFQGPPPADAQTLSGIHLIEVAADSPIASEQPTPAPIEVEDVVSAEASDVEEIEERRTGDRKTTPEELPEVESAGPPQPQPSEEPAFVFDLDMSASLSREDEALSQQLESGKAALDQGRLSDAIATFETVEDRAHDNDLRSTARRYLVQARAVRQDRLNQAVDKARKHARAQRRDLKGRRALWEAVLAIDPDSQEAQEELRRLEAEELEQSIRDTLISLRKPLETRDKRISEVEHARNQVLALLEGGTLRDPDLRQEVQELYDKLNALRDEILRLTELGTSSERSQQYEDAMEAYRAAFLAGYKEIVDNMTGESMDPLDALRRTRLAYFEDLKGRASQRYNDAKENLAAGSPEAAIKWLTDAQGLLAKVEEGGDDLRKEVQKLLDKAGHENDLKQEAEDLFLAAQDQGDPEEARKLLTRAKQRYPAYPQIDELIKGKESLVVGKIIQEITQDIANARGSLASRKFADARNFCNQALSRGLNLEAGSQELVAKRREAEALLKEIGDQEKSLQDLLNKMAKIDQALAKGDLRLAQRLLDLLDDDERKTAEAGERLAQLGLVSEDDDRFRQAQRAFQEQDNQLAVKLSNELATSTEYAEKAARLRSRAQARLWQQEIASRKRRGSDRDQLKKLALAIIGLKGFLPEEDNFLMKDAEQELAAIEQQEEEEGKHERELNSWKAMRRIPGDDPEKPLGNGQWLRWYGAYEVLRSKLPENLHGRLDQERDEGVKAWREEALRLAEQAQWDDEDSYASAYAILEPLYTRNLITTRDTFFRELAQQYHDREAEALAGSKNPKDLDAAVEHRREALKVAVPPAMKERAAYAAMIKSRALQLARLAPLNPGPSGALKVLQAQLEEHKPYLEEDIEVRQEIIRYAVEAGELETAAKQTSALEYLPNQAGVARLWSQLTTVAGTLNVETEVELTAKAQAVDDLVRIRDEATTNAYGTVQQVSEKLSNKLADSMYAAARSGSGHASNDEVIERIRLYSLVLRLRPDDLSAKAGIDAMKGRLGDLRISMVGRSNELLTGSLPFADRLKKGEVLLAEQAAVLEAFAMVGLANSNDAQQIAGAQEQLSRKVQQWHATGRQLERLEAEWRKAVHETWDVTALDDALSRTAATMDVATFGEWERKTLNLREQLDGLEKCFPDLETAWSEEKYEEVITTCDDVERRLNQARTVLKEKNLAVPERHARLYDPYLRKPVDGLSAVRKAAEDKIINRQDWQRWYQQFQQVSAQGSQLANRAEASFKSTPPCLTKAEADFREASSALNQTLTILAEIPTEVLCGVAKGISDKIPAVQIIGQCNRMIDLTRQRLNEISGRQPDLQMRIRRLEEFARSGRPLHVPANRETLLRLVSDAEALDSCHPTVEGYRLLLNRYEGKKG